MVKTTGWFANRKVSGKIAFLSAILCLLSVAVGSVGVFYLNAMERDIEVLAQEALADSDTLKTIESGILRERVMILSNISASTREKKDFYTQELAKARLATDAALEQLETWDTYGEEIEQITTKVAQYRDVIDNEYIPAADRGDMATVEVLRDTKAAPVVTEVSAIVSELIVEQTTLAGELVAHAKKQFLTPS